MRISHRHFDVGMAEYALQDQNIATIHHKVAGEGMAQNVGKLSCGKFNACSFQSRTKRSITIAKQPTFFIIRQRLVELFADWNGAVFSAFRVGVALLNKSNFC